MYYLCSENKGADQLCSYYTADLHLCFRLGKNLVFSRHGSYVYVSLINLSCFQLCFVAKHDEVTYFLLVSASYVVEDWVSRPTGSRLIEYVEILERFELVFLVHVMFGHNLFKLGTGHIHTAPSRI